MYAISYLFVYYENVVEEYLQFRRVGWISVAIRIEILYICISRRNENNKRVIFYIVMFGRNSDILRFHSLSRRDPPGSIRSFSKRMIIQHDSSSRDRLEPTDVVHSVGGSLPFLLFAKLIALFTVSLKIFYVIHDAYDYRKRNCALAVWRVSGLPVDESRTIDFTRGRKHARGNRNVSRPSEINRADRFRRFVYATRHARNETVNCENK